MADSSQKSQILICPELQGRVMTSTADGMEGSSFGWVNYELFASKEVRPHINAFGGEDRFWLGPEGGQFSIFFKKGDEFDYEHWQTPKFLDTEPFDIVFKNKNSVRFTKHVELQNFSGTPFKIKLERSVKLLSNKEISELLCIDLKSDLNVVGFETNNILQNEGSSKWEKSSGLLSIWILGMFNASPSSTVIIPFKKGDESQIGKPVNDSYFGKIPADRLLVKNDFALFKGDGKARGKVGISPKRAKSLLGSYDPQNGVLTIVKYSLSNSATDYVNFFWGIQKDPFSGDVVNSYNDGPATPAGKGLGNFYELESSSPAKSLKPNESIIHTHATIHFRGDKETLNRISEATLGVNLREVSTMLK